MKKENRKRKNVIVQITYKAAKRSANSSCSYWFGQSKLPDKVKKLRNV